MYPFRSIHQRMRDGTLPALESHLRAELILARRCRDRAMAAADAPLHSAWIGHFVRISHAMAATGNAIASLPAACGVTVSLPLTLRLPSLPRLPEQGKGVPPRI